MKVFRANRQQSAALSGRGFTLIELTVALAITTLIIVVLVSMTNTGLSVWQQTRDQVRTTEKAQGALAQIHRDLEQMQRRSGNSYEWLYAGQPLQGGDNGPKGFETASTTQMIFLTAATDRNNGRPADIEGDITGVSYRIAYRDHILGEGSKTNKGFPVFTLYRNLLTPRQTYATLLGKTQLNQAWSAVGGSDLAASNVITENILEMTYIFEVEYSAAASSGSNNTPTTQMVPVAVIAAGQPSQNACSEFRILGDKLEVQGSKGSQLANGRITSVTVSMSVVTDEGMQYVEDVRRGRRKNAMKMEDFCKRYSRQFSQRVAIPGV